MILTHRVKVSFPVLSYRSTVFHRTPRKPTATERVIVRMVSTMSSREPWCGVSLANIFTGILGVPEPAVLVVPALEQLVSLGVLRSTSNWRAVDAVALRDFELGGLAAELLERDEFPASPRTDEVSHVFDPHLGVLVGPGERGALKRQPGPIEVPLPPDHEYPEALVREAIPRERHSWWRAQSTIERVEPGIPETLWRHVEAEIQVTDDGALTLSPKREDQLGAFASLDIEQQAWIFECALKGTADERDLMRLPRTDFATLRAEATEVLTLSTSSGRIAEEGMRIGRRLPSLIDLEATSPRTLTALFGPAEDGDLEYAPWSDSVIVNEPTPDVAWNADRTGAIVHMDTEALDDVLYADANGTTLCARLVPLWIGSVERVLPLAFLVPRATRSRVISRATEMIGELLASTDEDDDLVLSVLVRPASAVWDQLWERIRSEASFSVAFDRLCSARVRFAAVQRGMAVPPRWSDRVHTLFSRELARTDTLDRDAVVPMLQAVAKKAGLPPSELARFAADVIAALGGPWTASVLPEVAALIAPLGGGGRIGFPGPAYPPSVISELLALVASKGLAPFLCGRNALDEGIRALDERARAVMSILGVQALKEIGRLPPRIDIDRLSKACAEWMEAVDRLRGLHPDVDASFRTSALSTVDAAVRQLRETCARLEPVVAGRFRGVYVIDTNVLIGEPEILSAFRDDELIVVSKRVIEELDDKKKDPRIGDRAGRAIQRLRDAPRERVRYQEADVTLLPPEYRTKGDNFVLAVALALRRSDPVLLTSDNALTVKGRAEGLRTMTPAELRARPKPPISSGGTRGSEPQKRRRR